MSTEISQEGFDLIAIQDIQNSTINITKISDSKYQEWNELLERERKYLERLSEDELDERQVTLKRIKDLEHKIDGYEEYVQNLLREANRDKGIYSRRLNRAKALINNGEIEKAREFYLEKKSELIVEKNEQLEKSKILSQEFLMMALLSQSDYENPNRFKQVCEYFNLSIETHKVKSNLFHYATFLFDHNKYRDSAIHLEDIIENHSKELSFSERATALNALGIIYRKEYEFEKGEKVIEESLSIFRELNEQKENNLNLASIALALNSLALLYSDQWKYNDAAKRLNESIRIWRKVCKCDEEIYLPYLAASLHNLGLILKLSKKYQLSEKKYFEAIKIRRKLTNKNWNLHLEGLALSLINLGNLYRESSNDIENKIKAKHNLYEGFEYFKRLSLLNPEKYLFSLFKAHLNLANTYRDLQDFISSENNYLEALKIIHQLDEVYGQVFILDYSRLTATLASFYQESIPSKEESIVFALEAYIAASQIFDASPTARGMCVQAVKVMKKWNMSEDEIEVEIRNRLDLLNTKNADN